MAKREEMITTRVTWGPLGHCFWLAIFIVAGVLYGPPQLKAQDPKPTEYQVKAVYLFNFARFVAWPGRIAAAGREPFNVCVLGQDPFGPSLDATVSGETIDGVHVAVKRISQPPEAMSCRVLFISSSEDGHLKEILTALDKRSVVTVSDIPWFARSGGMIQFLLEGNRVRFEVNVAALDHAGLSLSSEVLKLAINVRKTP